DIAVANIKRSAEPGSNGQPLLTNMVGVSAVDQYTLRLTFATVDPAVTYVFAYYPGAMASPAALAEPSLMATQSMGSGAFKVTNVTADGTYTLERNDNYWDKSHVYPAKIIMNGIVDNTTRLNALKTGQSDYTTLAPANYQSAKSEPSLQVQEYTSIA